MEKRYYSRCLYGGYERSDFRPSEGFSGKSWTSSHPRRKNAAVAISILLVLILGILFVGCKPKQVIVEKEKVVYQTKDSIVQRDSLVYVPVESQKDYTGLLDTLFLSTSIAKSWSVVDTNQMLLVGEIKNIKALQIKYVEVDKWHTKDSLVYVEKPIPYEVEVVKTKTPTWAWWTLFICIGLLCYVGIRLYLRFS